MNKNDFINHPEMVEIIRKSNCWPKISPFILHIEWLNKSDISKYNSQYLYKVINKYNNSEIKYVFIKECISNHHQ